MNSIVFGGNKGQRTEVYYFFGRYFCHGILFTRSHIIQLRWPILFIFCVLAPEGMNSIVFGGEKEEKSEDYCLLGRSIIQKIRYSCYEMCIMQRMTRIDKNDVLRQYNDKCIMCSDKLQYHLIISET